MYRYIYLYSIYKDTKHRRKSIAFLDNSNPSYLIWISSSKDMFIKAANEDPVEDSPAGQDKSNQQCNDFMHTHVIPILPVFQMNTNIYYLNLLNLNFFLQLAVVISYFYVDEIVNIDSNVFMIDIGFLTYTHLNT